MARSCMSKAPDSNLESSIISSIKPKSVCPEVEIFFTYESCVGSSNSCFNISEKAKIEFIGVLISWRTFDKNPYFTDIASCAMLFASSTLCFCFKTSPSSLSIL